MCIRDRAKAMEIQADLDKWVRFQLQEATGGNDAKNSKNANNAINPAQVKKTGRPKKSQSEKTRRCSAMGMVRRLRRSALRSRPVTHKRGWTGAVGTKG